MKKTIKMRNAKIVKNYSGSESLVGQIEEHHRLDLQRETFGGVVRTSKIVSKNGNTIETLNTIYEVQNWVSE